jgi:hypothetical protein
MSIATPPNAPRVFLISPARIGGPRSTMLLQPEAEFDLAIRLRQGAITIGEAYEFISGLYFRGKLAYAKQFAAPPVGLPGAMVMVPGLGLVPPDMITSADQLRGAGTVPVEESNEAFSVPLLRDAALLEARGGPNCRYVLLGSIATSKYSGPLTSVFGERLLFPEDFVGRGDMSRGGLMLRCVRSREELTYMRLAGAVRRGRRVPKLEPLSAGRRSGASK